MMAMVSVKMTQCRNVMRKWRNMNGENENDENKAAGESVT
jgi:hypothetical protein